MRELTACDKRSVGGPAEARGVGPTGTRRRLQALAAAGWATSQLATELGVTKSAIAALRIARRDRVLATTAARVAQLYESCWWRTPPGNGHTRVENYAAKRGWLPPWRWDGLAIDDPAALPADEPGGVDRVAVDETIAGRPVALTRGERRLVVDELLGRGLTAGAVADCVGLSARTIERYKSRPHAGRHPAGVA